MGLLVIGRDFALTVKSVRVYIILEGMLCVQNVGAYKHHSKRNDTCTGTKHNIKYKTSTTIDSFYLEEVIS